MATSFVQRSFAGGEIAPALYARADQAKYQSGLAECENFIVMRHGGVYNRPGFEYLKTTNANVGASANNTQRLWKFVYNADHTYVLLFSHNNIEIFRNGFQLTTFTGQQLLITTPYTASQLSGLQFVQSGNELTIVHKSHPPKVLKRIAVSTWGISTNVFTTTGSTTVQVSSAAMSLIKVGMGVSATNIPAGATVVSITDSIRFVMSIPATSNTTGTVLTLSFSPITSFTLSDQQTSPGVAPVAGVAISNGTGTATGGAATTDDISKGKYVRYLVTAAAQETYEESIAGPTSSANGKLTSGTTYNKITWTTVSGAAEYYVYKSTAKQNSFGYIGVSRGLEFEDTNISPDYSDTPAIEIPMFSEGNYPGCVGFYQQRQIYASTEAAIEKVWMSRSGSIKNFTRSSPFKDDDGITFTIQGREVSEVRHVVEVGSLVILTSSGEWIAAGDQDGAIRPQAINLRQQGYVGSAEIQPIVIANNILYVQARRNSVRDFRYDLQVDGYAGRDLTVFAAHLFDGYQINNWSFQQIPHSVAWVIRDDGVMLGLTYVKEHEIVAWHRHTTDGFFEDVVSLPEGDVDAVYVLVRRNINGTEKRFLERMYRRPPADFANIKLNSVYLDCAGTYNGSNKIGAPYGTTDTSAISITYDRSALYDLQTNVELTSSASLFTTSDIGNAFEVYDEFFERTVSYRIIQRNSSTSVTCIPSFARVLPPPVPGGVAPLPPEPEPITTTDWYRAVDTLTLPHLAGKTVSALADGNVQSGLEVDPTGAVTLQRTAVFIHVGIPYTSRIKTLSLDLTQQETLSDKKKLINRVSVFIESSRGIWASGDGKNYTEFKQRATEKWGDEIYLKTGIIEIPTASTWEKQGQVAIEQRDPLPLSVLSIVPRLSTSTQ